MKSRLLLKYFHSPAVTSIGISFDHLDSSTSDITRHRVWTSEVGRKRRIFRGYAEESVDENAGSGLTNIVVVASGEGL